MYILFGVDIITVECWNVILNAQRRYPKLVDPRGIAGLVNTTRTYSCCAVPHSTSVLRVLRAITATHYISAPVTTVWAMSHFRSLCHVLRTVVHSKPIASLNKQVSKNHLELVCFCSNFVNFYSFIFSILLYAYCVVIITKIFFIAYIMEWKYHRMEKIDSRIQDLESTCSSVVEYNLLTGPIIYRLYMAGWLLLHLNSLLGSISPLTSSEVNRRAENRNSWSPT